MPDTTQRQAASLPDFFGESGAEPTARTKSADPSPRSVAVVVQQSFGPVANRILNGG